MDRNTRDRSLGDGVYFSDEDYIGIWKRFGILIVDSVTLYLLCVASGYALVVTFLFASFNTYQMMYVLITWIYLVPIKRSRMRTVGYRLFGAKLATLQGKRPSLFSLTLREAMWGMGFVNLLFDLFWCSMDKSKQSFRDRLLQMYVVKNASQPIGDGEIHLVYYCALGNFYTLPAVYSGRKPNTSTC